ncbi:hypothetical protein GCM10029963_72000 [Micromonospora andamanensis]
MADHTSVSAGQRRAQRYLPLQILLGFLVIYFLVPFWWVIVNSSKDAPGLFGGGNTLWFADQIDYLGNLKQLFTYDGGIYLRWILNSTLYALAGGIGATVLAVMAGYGFAKYRFAARRFSFAVVLGALMVPATALVIPTFIMFAQLGLTNTIWAVILPSLLNPFGVYLIHVYARDAVPDEILDAARADGAGELRTFVQIALPLMRPRWSPSCCCPPSPPGTTTSCRWPCSPTTGSSRSPSASASGRASRPRTTRAGPPCGA